MKKHKKLVPPPAPIQPIPNLEDYQPPLDQLLKLGRPDMKRGKHSSMDGPQYRATEMPVVWDNYRALGVGEEHIPQLIRMADDEALNCLDEPEVFAPLHAWRALAQLEAVEAAPTLLPLFHADEEDDWVGEDMPHVFARFGPSVIPQVADYLAQPAHGLFPRITAARCLEEIGKRHRAARADCVAPLLRELEKFEANDPTFNAFLIDSLLGLDETDALPLIERVFEVDAVDDEIFEDIQAVREEFGLSRPPVRADFTDITKKFGL